MLSFREFVDQQTAGESKPWKAKKSDVLNFWRNLKPNMPISMSPVSELHKGTRFRQDGIRITGNPNFINSVLSRIQDIMSFENNGIRLDVEYRQIESTTDTDQKPEFVFYVHLVHNDESAAQL